MWELRCLTKLYAYVLLSHVQIKVKFNHKGCWMDVCGQWWSEFRGYVTVLCFRIVFMILLEISYGFMFLARVIKMFCFKHSRPKAFLINELFMV